MEISLHSFPIFDNRSDFSVRDPVSAFGAEVFGITLSRTGSSDSGLQFLAHSPFKHPGGLATVIEGKHHIHVTNRYSHGSSSNNDKYNKVEEEEFESEEGDEDRIRDSAGSGISHDIEAAGGGDGGAAGASRQRPSMDGNDLCEIRSRSSMSTLDSTVRSITPQSQPDGPYPNSGVDPIVAIQSATSAIKSNQGLTELNTGDNSNAAASAANASAVPSSSPLPMMSSPPGTAPNRFLPGSSNIYNQSNPRVVKPISTVAASSPAGPGISTFVATDRNSVPGLNNSGSASAGKPHNNSFSYSGSSNARNVSILSSILSSHELSGRYLGDDRASEFDQGQPDVPQHRDLDNVVGNDMSEPLLGPIRTSSSDVSLVSNLIPPPSPLTVSAGVAYSSNVARQYRSDSLTQQRLGQLIAMAEEEEDASAELLRRSLYSHTQSMRSSLASFVACKKVAYVAILFSDIKDSKQ
jgi:hypothetical protein